MTSFEYLEPGNIGEAVSMLVEHGPGAKIMAGGTDLVLKLEQGLLRPRHVINISLIDELNYIRCGEEIRIGATTTLRQIARSTQLEKSCPLLVNVAQKFAALSIANMATLGGNLCNACPACDMGSPLIVLSAEAVIRGPKDVRTVPVEKFFKGPGRTIMEPDEILSEVRIPRFSPQSRWAYLKHVIRAASDLAIVSVAVSVLIEDQYFKDVKIALGAVYPTPMRARPAEEALIGEKASAENVEKAALLAREQCRPITDVRSSAAYRKEVAYVVTRRALQSCLNPTVGE